MALEQMTDADPGLLARSQPREPTLRQGFASSDNEAEAQGDRREDTTLVAPRRISQMKAQALEKIRARWQGISVSG